MPRDDRGSVTHWIGELKDGDPAAAGHLWDRYYAVLVRLARGALGAARCRGLLEALDEESLRGGAGWRLEGYTGEETAEQLRCNRRTVTRKLELIRAAWVESGLS